MVPISLLCHLHTEQDEDGEDFDKEMGELEGDNPEQIDRNMWVPEEQDGTEVSYDRVTHLALKLCC